MHNLSLPFLTPIQSADLLNFETDANFTNHPAKLELRKQCSGCQKYDLLTALAPQDPSLPVQEDSYYCIRCWSADPTPYIKSLKEQKEQEKLRPANIEEGIGLQATS